MQESSTASTTATGKPAAVVSRWRYAWFVPWMIVGASYPLVILGALTIGKFVAPFAYLGTLVLASIKRSHCGMPGAISGIGLPFFLVGMWLPWVGFPIGLLFFASGIVLIVRGGGRGKPQPLWSPGS
ncbi:MAG: hypothetical protein JHC87_09940 [Thermoleophilaceae bacterium]|nr:hypothetical protein [Thermoleophilaceae bacterium]